MISVISGLTFNSSSLQKLRRNVSDQWKNVSGKLSNFTTVVKRQQEIKKINKHKLNCYHLLDNTVYAKLENVQHFKKYFHAYIIILIIFEDISFTFENIVI